MPARFTTAQFIEKAKSIHGDRYDYSHVNYSHSLTSVDIICSLHGVFSQLPINHLKHRCGCPVCGIEKRAAGRRWTTKDFIAGAIAAHGHKYDYSRVDYVHSQVPVIIICPVHGEFSQTQNDHVWGKKGCRPCSIEASIGKMCTNAEGEIPSKLWGGIIAGARARGIEFNLTPDQAWKKYLDQNGKCALSGLPIGFRDGRQKDKSYSNTASLDRIDSKRGYATGNIQWVHKRINLMKNTISDEEFIAFCMLIVQKYEDDEWAAKIKQPAVRDYITGLFTTIRFDKRCETGSIYGSLSS